MNEVKLPAMVESALNSLDKIINDGKPVPFKENLITVDKNALREIYTQISREKGRLAELREDYISDAKEEAERMIEQTRFFAANIVESAVKDTSLIEENALQAAMVIKTNAMDHLEYTLERIHGVLEKYKSVINEIEDEINQFKPSKN